MFRLVGRCVGLVLLAAAAANAPAEQAEQHKLAAWHLVPERSTVSFATVKNGIVTEGHRFQAVTGLVDGDGKARVTVPLSSVDTLIDIRDERLRTMLFETELFPEAQYETTVDVPAMLELAIGETHGHELNGTLTLHGQSVPVFVSVVVTRLRADTFSVSSIRPFVLSAGSFSLSPGIEALREIAGLQSITPSVPVSIQLTFVQSD